MKTIQTLFVKSARSLYAVALPWLALLAAPGTAQARVWTHVAAACTVDDSSGAKFDTNEQRRWEFLTSPVLDF